MIAALAFYELAINLFLHHLLAGKGDASIEIFSVDYKKPIINGFCKLGISFSGHSREQV